MPSNFFLQNNKLQMSKVGEAAVSLFMPFDTIQINKLDVKPNNFSKPEEDDIMIPLISTLENYRRTQNVSKRINKIKRKLDCGEILYYILENKTICPVTAGHCVGEYNEVQTR